MSIYKTAINKPITTILIFVAVIVFGLFCLKQLPIDQYPDFDAPYACVMTSYSASASEIETNVTKVLENSLNSVDGLKKMTSTSKDNLSLITLEFKWGQNLDEVINDIRSSIDMVYDNLPDGCSRPLIFKFSTSMMPIIQYAITAKESYPGLDKIIDDKITNELNRINGIGNITVSGAPKRYVYINLDPNKLDQYNISLEQVGSAIGNNNLNLSSGSVKVGKEQYQLRVEGEYQSSAEINNIVINTQNGKEVFLHDIATVKDTIKDVSLEEKVNGKDGVRLMITKQTGANTVQIAEQVQKTMEKIKKTLPPDIKIEPIYDSSTTIHNSINGLTESVYYALLFVVLVVLFFLGRWRATFIIALSIPICLVVAFIYLYVIDSSLNIISLCSLTVAIGLVVDDAIVVLENITKHIDKGESPREAAIYATNEVWVSVIASTLVIIAVFMPLTMLGGQAGILFKQLGWIVSISVATSVTVAISLTPMLASKLMKAKDSVLDKFNAKKEKGLAAENTDENTPVFSSLDSEEEKKWKSGKINGKNKKNKRWSYNNTVMVWLSHLDTWYSNVLRACLKNKKKTILIAVGIFILTLIPAKLGFIGTNFMAEQDNSRMTVTIKTENGTRVEETSKIARKCEMIMKKVAPEIKIISTSCGSDDDAGLSSIFSSTSNNKISMNIRTVDLDQRNRSIFEIAESIRQGLKQMPEVIEYQVSTNAMGQTSNSVDIEVYGYDFNATNRVTEQIKQMLKNVNGARDVNVDREDDRSELQVVFDKEKLAMHGLNTATASAYIRNRVNGETVGYLKEDGDEYDIVVRLQENYRNSIDKLGEMSIITPTGERIKLKELAKISEYWCPPDIARKNRQRCVTISVTPVGTSLGELANDIQGKLNKIQLPQDISVKVAGAYEDQQESFGDMGILIVLVMLLVYIVMASQFESFAKPFIIMISIPFAISGVILALLITQVSLDMVGALGVIMLVGIVVKNGIVLVDYINLMRDRGYELNEAIALSGHSRLRPVLMTALTAILGMVPMALSSSEGSEIWRPMGIVVIGGLFFSTIVTLIIVPVLYASISRRGERDKEKDVQSQFIFMQLPDTLDEDQAREKEEEKEKK